MTHTFIYSMIWLVLLSFYGLFIAHDHTLEVPLYVLLVPILFALITFIIHTITDYITSREVHKYFDKKDTHNGFIIIGLDQILHYVQIYLTIKLLYS